MENGMIYTGVGRNVKENISDDVWSIRGAIEERLNETSVSTKMLDWESRNIKDILD